MKIQLKRSNVLDGSTAKEPTAAQMEFGELAVNYNNGDPAVFLKDSNENVIRIAGKGAIGTDDRYVEVTGDNMTGDLTLGADPAAPNITLNAADGSSIFALDATINSVTVGRGAGDIETNVAVGTEAFGKNISGSSCVAVGRRALESNTTGTGNTSVGQGTLRLNIDGAANTAMGNNALRANTSGSNNCAMGQTALNGNEDGEKNTALGHRTLYDNKSGSFNVAVGSQSGEKTTGSHNTFVGETAGSSNTTGEYNAFIGNDAGSNVIGSNNTFIGSFNGGSGASATLSDTISLSAGATEKLRINDDGLLFGTDSNLPTAPNFGVRNGGRVYTSGGILVGGTLPPSGLQEGNITLNSNGNSVFSGTITCGGSPVGGGVQGVSFDPRGFCQATRDLGSSHAFRTYVTGNGTPTVNIYAGGDAMFSGTVTATVVPPSDARFKENITPAKPQLTDVVALGGLLKNYDWNDQAPVNDELRSQRQLGLIAQEVAEVCPSIVKTIKRTETVEVTPAVTGPKGSVIIEAVTQEVDDSYSGLSTDALIMKLIGAVAELSAEVQALKAAAH